MRSIPVLALAVLAAGCATDKPTDAASEPEIPRFDGAAFRIDFASTTVVEPAGADDLMDLFLGDLLMIVQFSGDEADPSVIAALGSVDDGIYSQDVCSRTIAFDSELAWTDPELTIAAVDWTFEAYDLSVPMRRLNMSAVMGDDGASLDDFGLTAYLDAADFTVAEGETPPCELAGSLGIDCQPCEDDATRAECLSIALVDGTAPRVTLASDLVPMSAAEVAALTACELTGE